MRILTHTLTQTLNEEHFFFIHTCRKKYVKVHWGKPW